MRIARVCAESLNQPQDLRLSLIYFQLLLHIVARTEHSINDVLADLLRGTRRAWREGDVVASEDTGRLKGTSGQPDILVIEPNVSPVVIETEVLPAITVESEAISRLGAQLRTTGKKILSSIAVRFPPETPTKVWERIAEGFGNCHRS
jgi:hypothetical protein